MKIELDKYIEAGFDSLWLMMGHTKEEIKWVAGFFCQGEESMPNHGLICYLRLVGKKENMREKHLSPVCSTPQKAIDEAYKLWRKIEKEVK